MDNKQLETTIVECLNDYKAQNVVALDVKDITNVTDTMIIATATSNRHAATMIEKLQLKLRDAGVRAEHADVNTENSWQVLDFIDVVVHVMDAETRELYNLEKLWQKTAEKRDASET
jgi:ribosome-associated protein